MPRYYFHVHDGDGLDRDHIGTELTNIHEARTEAVIVARELCHLWDDLPPGALNSMAIEVADETGQIVLIVSFPVPTGQVD
jgi:dihydroxyacetone kinase DhaKLM complex PTS-EIIA-like component DhaM